MRSARTTPTSLPIATLIAVTVVVFAACGSDPVGECDHERLCPTGKRCVENYCRDCEIDQQCAPGRCVKNECVECRDNGDCGFRVCHEGKCVECAKDGDCSTGHTCTNNRCYSPPQEAGPRPEPKPEPVPEPRPEPKPEPAAEPKPEPSPEPIQDTADAGPEPSPDTSSPDTPGEAGTPDTTPDAGGEPTTPDTTTTPDAESEPTAPDTTTTPDTTGTPDTTAPDAGSETTTPDTTTAPDTSTTPDAGSESTTPDTSMTPDTATAPDTSTTPDTTSTPDGTSSPDTPAIQDAGGETPPDVPATPDTTAVPDTTGPDGSATLDAGVEPSTPDSPAVSDAGGEGAMTEQIAEALPEATPRVPQIGDLVINEVLADPPSTGGDANKDGTRVAEDDEFVELVNVSADPLDLGGIEIWDKSAKTFTFPAGTVLQPGKAVVVFGWQTATGIPGPVGTGAANSNFCGAQVFVTASAPSAGGLKLSNSSDAVQVKGLGGTVLSRLDWGGTGQVQGDRDTSMVRDPDKTGNHVLHTTANSSLVFSPGCKVDGTAF